MKTIPYSSRASGWRPFVARWFRRRPLRRLLPAVTALAGLLTTCPVSAAPGDLDLQFNGTGWITPPLGTPAPQCAGAAGMAVQSDGKIVISGTLMDATSTFKFFAARFHPNGAFDTSFNGTGFNATHVGPNNHYAWAMALQNDGKILVGGETNSETTRNPVMLRYNTDGTLDTTFGSGGKVVITISSILAPFFNLAVQSDGKILATTGYEVFRFLNDGSLDPLFGTFGMVAGLIDPDGLSPGAEAIAVLPGGKILVAGRTIFRLFPNGIRDATFGASGSMSLPLSTISLALQNDGKILAASHLYNDINQTNLDFAVVRLLPDGGLDPAFNSTGQAGYDFGPGRKDFVQKVVTQPDGKIILIGGSCKNDDSGVDLAAVRFNPNGSRDDTFGPGGRVLSTFGDQAARCSAAALQVDGKLLLGGSLTPVDGGVSRVLLARFIAMEYTSFEAWRSTWFGFPDNSGPGANTNDFDGDGLANLTEFAFGLNPGSGTSLQLPGFTLAGGNITGAFTQPAGVSGITYTAQWSPSMLPGSWTSIPDTGTGGAHLFTIPAGAGPRKFFRYTVTEP